MVYYYQMKAVTEYTLYAKRYVIGYAALIAGIAGLFAMVALFVPGALRQGELDASLVSGALSMQSIDPSSVVNLPYFILQRLSFLAFGVTPLTIKLPSIILGVLTIIGVFVLIRTWFRRNVAIITTLIAASTAQFLFLLQDGTPAIMFSFVAIWLLAASTFVTRSRYFTTLWKVVACVLMATALYIPLGIYLVIALIVTASLHPHIRYVIRRVSRARLIIAILLGLVSISPLVYAIIVQPSVALVLLGIPTDGINLMESVPLAMQNLFGFVSTSNSFMLRPIYPLGLAILMCIGVYRLLTVKHTARSYTTIILGACLLVVVLLEPAHIPALYPLAVLMVAMGIATLIANWYRLFPRNPYARVAGLVPISILVAGLLFTGSMSYINNYTYNPNILSYYSTDLRLFEQTLNNAKSPVVLVTSHNERAFYGLVAHYDKRFMLGTLETPGATTIVVTRAAYTTAPPERQLATIITNARSGNADRFYIYKATTGQ